MSLIMKEQIFEHRKKCRKNLKHIISLFFFNRHFSLVPTPKAIFEVLHCVSERQLQSPSCKLSKLSFKSNTFVLVRLKGRENEQFSHPMGDIERGGEFTRLLKS